HRDALGFRAHSALARHAEAVLRRAASRAGNGEAPARRFEQQTAGERTGESEKASRSPPARTRGGAQEGQHADLRGTWRGPPVRRRGALLQESVLRLEDDAHRRTAADGERAGL